MALDAHTRPVPGAAIGSAQRTASEQRSREATASPQPARRSARPVLWWASLGAAAVAMQLYVYIGWITSSDFKSTPTGPDPVPHEVKVNAWILQSAFSAGAVAVIVWLVWSCLKARQLTFPARIWIAWVSIIWLDPWANLIRPQMMFNSYYFNRGSWVGHIPWWISPNGHLLPQPFLIETANYMSMVVMTILGARLIGVVARRRPRNGLLGLTVPVWLAMAVFIFVIEELVVVRGGWVIWSSNIDALTLWSGTHNAMPLTEMALWSFTITAISYQIYAYNTRGEAPAERGIDAVPVHGPARTALSTFALIGLATAVMGLYSVSSAAIGLYSGTTPSNLPSYFTNGSCGSAAAPCPVKNGPIYHDGHVPR